MTNYYLDIIPINYDYRNQINHAYKFYIRDLSTNQDKLYDKLPLEINSYFVQDIKFCKSLLSLSCDVELIDIKFLSNDYSTLEFVKFPLHNHYTNLYKDISNIITIIPNNKLLEHCRKRFDNISHLLNNENNQFLDFYNNIFVDVIISLESNPINIDLRYFKNKNILIDDKLYSNYNIYNTYSRPTNVVNGYNITAISTKDDSRKAIIPNNDYLIEFDYKNYQIHLLADLLNHKFKTNDIYTELMEVYNSDNREESKKESMWYLFGDIKENPFPDNIFFKKFFDFKNKLSKLQYFQSPISNKKILLENTNKDIPRILQVLETEKNILTMKNIQDFLSNKKTKLILYFYDSFLIDYSKEDKKQTLIDIKNIIQQETYCSIKFGKNFKEMELFDL
jgi:hypothetical protein